MRVAAAADLFDLVLKRRTCPAGAPGSQVLLEKLVNLLERPFCRLGVCEEGVGGHGKAKCAKDHVRFPLDVGEGGRDEEGESKVEAMLDVSDPSHPA